MDAKKIRDMLNGRAEAVCAYLLPAGKVVGGQFVVGDAAGSQGDSLKVFLTGGRAGFWHDFAAPAGQREGGDIFHLWMAARGCPFPKALEEARAWLGVPPDEVAGWKRAANKPAPAAPAQPGTKDLDYTLAQEGGAVWKWLTEERKVSAEAIRAYRVGEAFVQKGGRHCVVFPFFDPEGNLVRLKYRDIRDKGYMFQHPKKADAGQYRYGAPCVLFGIQAIPADADGVALTEGEIDAMTMFDHGWPGVSLPQGAQAAVRKDGGVEIKDTAHDEWIEACHGWMERFVTILMALDADAPGLAARELLVRRLGMDRCRILEFPDGRKDANQCAQDGVDLVDALMQARECDPPELKRPTDFAREIWEEFFPVDGRQPGDELPWALPFRLRAGEVTIWHGYSGSGKSVCLGYVLMSVAANCGHKSLTASLEMPARKTFKNMMRQGLGKAKPRDEAEFRAALAWMDEYFFVFDRVGEATSDQVIEIFEYAAKKYGVRHFVLDSLMKLGDIPYDGYDQQRALVNRLGVFADRYAAHVHLVAHSRKPDQRHPEMKHFPDKSSVSGHGDITNGVDNVVCVWRNREKEQMVYVAELKNRQAAGTGDDLLATWEGREDALFVVQKQRETGAEPTKRLFFSAGDGGSWQYHEERGQCVRIIPGDDEANDANEVAQWADGLPLETEPAPPAAAVEPVAAAHQEQQLTHELADPEPPASAQGGVREEMVEEAIRIIRETRRATTSSLQRRLRIGYTLAATIMDRLEERGVIGPPAGSEPREIYLDDVSEQGKQQEVKGETEPENR